MPNQVVESRLICKVHTNSSQLVDLAHVLLALGVIDNDFFSTFS